MPKIPTLESQSPGARPILMDVARGGGRAAEAGVKEASAISKSISKIAELFNEEDKDGKSNRIDAGANALTGYIQDSLYTSLDKDTGGRDTIKAFDSLTTDDILKKKLEGIQFEDDDERDAAFNIAKRYLGTRRLDIVKQSLSRSLAAKQNRLEKKVEGVTKNVMARGIYANSLFLPKYEDGKYTIPDLVKGINDVLEFAKKTKYLSAEDYEVAKNDPRYSLLDFRSSKDKDGKIRYEMSYAGDFLEANTQQKERIARTIVHSTLSKLNDHAETYIQGAKTVEDLEAFDKPIQVVHEVTGFRGRYVGLQDVKVKNEVTGKTEPLSQIQHLEYLLMANKKHLNVQVRGSKTVYDVLRERIFGLRKKYIDKMDDLLKGMPGEKLKKRNEFYKSLYDYDDKVKKSFDRVATKEMSSGQTPGFEWYTEKGKPILRDGRKVHRVAEFKKDAIAAEKFILSQIEKYEDQYGDVINYRTAMGVYDSFKKSNADKLSSLLMMEADGLYIKHGGKASAEAIQNFKSKFYEYASGLPKAHRKEITAYLSMLERGALPAGYRTRASDALEHFFVKTWRRPFKTVKDEAGPEVVQHGKARLEFWKIAREGLKDKNGKWLVQPNFLADPRDIIDNHLNQYAASTSSEFVEKSIQRLAKGQFSELTKPDGLPGLHGLIEAYNSEDEKQIRIRSREVAGSLDLFLKMHPEVNKKGIKRLKGKLIDLKIKMRMAKINRLRGRLDWNTFVRHVYRIIRGANMQRRMKKAKE